MLDRCITVQAVPPLPSGADAGDWARRVDDDWFARHGDTDECWRAMVPGEFTGGVWQPAPGRDWIVHVRRTPGNAYRRTIADARFLHTDQSEGH
jgi:hypothetical protein